MQFSDDLHSRAHRIARQIGERNIPDLDDFDRFRARPGGGGDRGWFLASVLDRVRSAKSAERIDAIDLPRNLSDRGPDRIGDGEVMRFDDVEVSDLVLDEIEAPPPTMTGNGSAERRERSTAVSSISAIFASERGIRPLSRSVTFL